MNSKLLGDRHVININDSCYPGLLLDCKTPPENLFVIGSPEALKPGLAIVGARKATPYGTTFSEHFAGIAASRNIPIISGGALGCDSAAHRGALSVGGKTVVVLGGGCDRIYPTQNRRLFQDIIDNGGAIISENSWNEEAFGWRFRARNRIIAGLAAATLIIEAGLPSGTFSTADEALAAGREVIALPGSITSKQSRGSNRLIFQGALPVIDDESFESILDTVFPNSTLSCNKLASKEISEFANEVFSEKCTDTTIVDAIKAQPLSLDEIKLLMSKDKGKEISIADLMLCITALESCGKIAKYPDGKFGPVKQKRLSKQYSLHKNKDRHA